jgi:type VI protein secretion system component VasK
MQAKAKGQARERAVGEKRSSNAVILLGALGVVAVLLGIVLLKRRPRRSFSSKQPLEDVVRRGAAVAEGGAQVTRRWAAETAHRSLELAATATWSARRRRNEVAWYMATGLFAAGIGLVVTVWLNGA